MATRFYASSTNAPTNYGSLITPSFDGSWTSSNNMVRRTMSTARTGSGLTTLLRTKSDSTRRNFGIVQLVSRPLEAGQSITTSDTVRAVFQAWQNTTSGDCSAKMSVRIFSQDGTTLQATLLALDTATTNILEWTTTASSKLFPRMNDADPLKTLANYVTQDGDRIVCDVGWLCANTTFATAQGKLTIGDPIDGTDYSFANGTTGTGYVGWIEFSMDLVFKQVLRDRRQKTQITGIGTRRMSQPSVLPQQLLTATTRDAADFVAFMGVNSHDYGLPNIYANRPALIEATGEIGIKDLRGHPLDGFAGLDSTYKTSCFLGGYSRTTDTAVITAAVQDYLDTTIQPFYDANRLSYIEMPNEPDLFTRTTGGSIDPSWPAYTAAFCKTAYPLVKSQFPDIPVLGTTLGHGTQTKIDQLLTAFAGDTPGDYADIGNIHCYPGTGQPHSNFDSMISQSTQLYPNMPYVVTESGYNTAVNGWQVGLGSGFNESVYSWYMIKMYLEYFGLGVQKFWAYEMLDRRPNAESTSFGTPLSPANQQVEANLGMYRGNNDHNVPDTAGAKPVVQLINDLRSMISGAAPGSNTDVTYQIDGSPFAHILIETTSKIYMVLWQRTSLWKDAIPAVFNFFSFSFQGGSAGSELSAPDQTARVRFSVDKELVVKKLSDAGTTPVTSTAATVHEIAVPAKDVLIIEINPVVV